jgi:hypothetical protein
MNNDTRAPNYLLAWLVKICRSPTCSADPQHPRLTGWSTDGVVVTVRVTMVENSN